MINPLIIKINTFLKKAGFPYAFCGGSGLELFLNKRLRPHGDIDISVFFDDRNRIISFMHDNGWTVYEACSNGIVHIIENTNSQKFLKNNLFCVKDCPRFQAEHIENGMFQCKIEHTEQTGFDYIEFLFDARDGENIFYRRKPDIVRGKKDAVLYN